jgi:YD repeat-containing protein
MTNPTTKMILHAAQRRRNSTRFYDARGNVVGRSATDSSGTVTNYDARGKVISRESMIGPSFAVHASTAFALPASRPQNEAPVDFLYRAGIRWVELCEAGNISFGRLDVVSEHDPIDRLAAWRRRERPLVVIVATVSR